jgi:hypothetical protein
VSHAVCRPCNASRHILPELIVEAWYGLSHDSGQSGLEQVISQTASGPRQVYMLGTHDCMRHLLYVSRYSAGWSWYLPEPQTPRIDYELFCTCGALLIHFLQAIRKLGYGPAVPYPASSTVLVAAGITASTLALLLRAGRWLKDCKAAEDIVKSRQPPTMTSLGRILPQVLHQTCSPCRFHRTGTD